MGADAAINSETSNVRDALWEHTGGVGPDVVIDAAGGPGTPEQAVTLARVGGTAVLVAIYTAKPAFDFNTVVARETRVLGSLGYSKSDVRNAVALISAGKVQTAPLVSDVIGLDQVIDVGFARMMQGEKDFFRILVDPSR